MGSGKTVSESGVWERATNKFTIAKAPAITHANMETKFDPGSKVIFDGKTNDKKVSSSWVYNPTTERGNLEISPSRIDKNIENTVTNINLESDPDTNYQVVSSDLTNIVPDTGKLVHSVSDSNFNITMPGHGEEKQMFTFRITKSFC